MPVTVALLRGINVGAHKRMKMADLRKVFASLELEDAQTYLQSGNVVFRTAERNFEKLGKRIEAAIVEAFGFGSDVILRSLADMRRVVAGDPFQDRKGLDPAKLTVMFLERPLTAFEQKALNAHEANPEEVVAAGSEIYIYFPEGMGRSKLSLAKVLKANGTVRNWRSIGSILELLETLAEE